MSNLFGVDPRTAAAEGTFMTEFTRELVRCFDHAQAVTMSIAQQRSRYRARARHRNELTENGAEEVYEFGGSIDAPDFMPPVDVSGRGFARPNIRPGA